MPRTNPLPQRELEIAQRFKQVRLEARAPRSYVAAALGVDSQVITRIELGRAPLKYGLAARFCTKFSITPRWLATGAGPKTAAITLPPAQSLGVRDTDSFSAVHQDKLASILFGRSDDEILELSNAVWPGSPGQRLWMSEELAHAINEWLRSVPDAKCAEFKQALIAWAQDTLESYGRDDWEREARRRLDMDQIEKLREEWDRPLFDLTSSRTLRELVVTGIPPGSSPWDTLLWRLRLALHGNKSREEFREELKIPSGVIDNWLNRRTVPTADAVCRILIWLTRKEMAEARHHEDSTRADSDSKVLLTSSEAEGKAGGMSLWQPLKNRLRKQLSVRGSMAALLRWLHNQGRPITRQAVWGWLKPGSRVQPKGETVLHLQQWLKKAGRDK